MAQFTETGKRKTTKKKRDGEGTDKGTRCRHVCGFGLHPAFLGGRFQFTRILCTDRSNLPPFENAFDEFDDASNIHKLKFPSLSVRVRHSLRVTAAHTGPITAGATLLEGTA